MKPLSLEKIKADYKKGLITKPDYIKKMYLIHRHLFDYSRFLKNTDIGKIEIGDDRIVLVSRDTDIKLICPPNDQRTTLIEALNFGSSEKEETEMILGLMEKGFTFFDIGANVGWYTVKIAKTVKKAKVFSFEPIPQTFAILKKNTEINEVKNPKLYNFGFSDENKKTSFYFYEQGSGNASLKNVSHKTKIRKISGRVKKLDDFIKEIRIKPDFIKCDVEGAELFVFKGGFATIRDHKPIIFAEMMRKWTVEFDYNPNITIQLLAGIGYKCFTIEKKKLKEFIKMDEQTPETNFIFLHQEKHQKQIKKLT